MTGLHGVARFWALTALVTAALLAAPDVRAVDLHPADRARTAILELDFAQAEEALDGAMLDDTAVALERGRLLLYATRYEEALRVLERADVAQTKEGARLAQLARDCARAIAGAYVVHDLHRDVVVRMQDGRDQVLVPLIAEVIHASRLALREGLGVELPSPMRVELVRDHFSLSAMTGLPEEAARTTGTVAIANWGRVAMVSPRSMEAGYPWMDTLAHELAHVALGMGTQDRAPLWLQEGIAKYFEKSWRRPDVYDDHPDPDVLAAWGFEKGLALEFDALGPSVAMLPSPEQAMVVYAEVESFIRYLVADQGAQVLVELVPRIRRAGEGDGVSDALLAMTGKDLGAWYASWRATLPPASGRSEKVPGWKEGEAPDVVTIRNVRLGRLLLERGHDEAAAKLLEPAREAIPQELQVRYLLAKAFFRQGKIEKAWGELEQAEPPMTPHAGAFALRGRLLADRGDLVGAEASFFRGLALNPWSSEVACEMLEKPLLPADDTRAWVCRAARAWPRY